MSSSSWREAASNTDCVGDTMGTVSISEVIYRQKRRGRGSLASLGPHRRPTAVAFRLAGGIIYGPVFFTGRQWSIIECQPRKLKRALDSSQPSEWQKSYRRTKAFIISDSHCPTRDLRSTLKISKIKISQKFARNYLSIYLSIT